jgi:type IV pilus assembly protein PilB
VATASQRELLTSLLREVSRPFYLAMRVLPGAIRPQVSLAYLLACTTDLIAETAAVPVAERLAALAQLRRRIVAVCDLPADYPLLVAGRGPPTGVPRDGAGDADEAGERCDFARFLQGSGAGAAPVAGPARVLLERVEEALYLLSDLEAEDRQSICKVMETITNGQELDLWRFEGQPVVAGTRRMIALQTEAELDSFTYHVAGCVGEFWTRMCRTNLFPGAPLDDAWLIAQGIRLGKGLQLVNILRDLPADLRRRRCYLPAERLASVGLQPVDLLEPASAPRLRTLYHGWLDVAQAHLAAGWAYACALPRGQFRVQLACAWPVLIGARTLGKMRLVNPLEAAQRVQLSRREMRGILVRAALASVSTRAWRRLFPGNFPDRPEPQGSTSGTSAAAPSVTVTKARVIMEPKLKNPTAEDLVVRGLLTEAQLELALREWKQSGGSFWHILFRLGFVSAEALADYLAAQVGVKRVDVGKVGMDSSLIQVVPHHLAKRFHALPLSRQGKTLTVALSDPTDMTAVDALQQFTGLHVDVVAATDADIQTFQARYYKSEDTIQESIGKALDEKVRDGALSLEQMLSRLGTTSADAPVIRLVAQLISKAINSGASDIHFEPEQSMMRIRTRVDGMLVEDFLLPKVMETAVTTRMKILAGMDLAKPGTPQDGRAVVNVSGREVNLRVSCLPTRFGENIVARILDPESQPHSLLALGMAPDTEMAFRGAYSAPHGVILVTGPTGSGKTTTLYTALRQISTMKVSTFTLEDPIEYTMPLVRQTQIKEETGLTFSAGLRALLRQDPDVILVGETRDTETAQLMVRAALTGHLVLSTLHTNDAAGAIPRLVDMGVEPYLLPASLIAVLAQRLLRKVCPKCRTPLAQPEEVLRRLKITPPSEVPIQLWQSGTCDACKLSGYKGRQGVYELMVVDERFHDPIVSRAGAPEFLRLGRQGGMRTMFEDGLLRALQGMTTMDELLRVTRLAA